MKPKVGEIWMVEYGYSWGICLVEVTEVLQRGFFGVVIDTEGNFEETSFNIDGIYGHQWCFAYGLAKYIKKISN